MGTKDITKCVKDNYLRCKVYQNIVTRKFFPNFEIDGISTPWLKFETFTAVGYALFYDTISAVADPVGRAV
jgi:hypothetical protein